ncbi:hypothetical protein [Acinetobacter sp. 197]|uniref:hypothetical protein n=1 Tax=Acinetobacter TaxID=469 RepID=UPI003A8C8486
MDFQKEREAFQNFCEQNFDVERHEQTYFDEQTQSYENDLGECTESINMAWSAWQAKAQAVPAQLDVNSILHDIDCYFDNGLSNTERAANNLLQSIYEKLSGEVKAQEPDQ